MTLVEMMVAIAIGSVLFAALGALTIYSARSFRSMIDYSELNRDTRYILDQISREIRQSRGLVNSQISSNLTTLVFNSGGSTGGTFSVVYDKPAKTLKLTKSGAEQVLEDCTYFKSHLFQQSPLTNAGFVEITNIALCKMVQFDWICARSDVATTNSESVQSMKIVIRKKS